MTDDYQEIDMTEYIKTILRHWKLILTIIIVFLIIAVLYTKFFTSKVYQAETLIKTGQVKEELIMPKDQTVAQLLTHRNAREILAKIPQKKQTPITSGMVSGFLKGVIISPEIPENFILISYQDSNPERAKLAVELLKEKILALHKQKYDIKVKFINLTLAQKERELDSLKLNLQKTEEAIERLSNLRYPASYATAQGIGFATYLTTRNEQQTSIKTLTEEIENEKFTIENKIWMSEPISSTSIPYAPVLRQRLSVNGMIALVVGFFIGIFAAFGKEWWKKNRLKFKNL